MNAPQPQSPNKFKWGFSSLGCPRLTLAEMVETGDRLGFRYLELRTLENTTDLPAIFADPAKFALLEQLASEGRIQILGASFGIASRENDYDALAALGELAERSGVPYIRVFGGFDYREPLDQQRIDIALENLVWFRSHGFRAKLALETHDGCSSAARSRQLSDAGGDLPIIWDAHHTFRYGGESFQESYHLLAGRIIDIHVKDSLPGAEGKFIAAVPGAGDLPIPELSALLRKADYSGLVTLEYEKFWEPHLPNLEIALAAVNELWK